MAAKRRIISCALTGVLAASTVGLFAGCDALTGANVIWIAFAETGYGRAYMEQWCEDFKKKYPNEDYEFELEGDPDITAQIYQRLNTKTDVPDVIFCLDTNWKEWAAKNWLEPLDTVYQADADREHTITSFMNEGLRDYGRVNGRYYSIPWTDGATGLIYNETMFKANGWTVPTTVEDLYTLCNTINALPCNNDSSEDNDIAPFAWSGSYSSYWDFVVENWWAQYEGVETFREFFNYGAPLNEDGTFKFENDETVATDYGSPEVYTQEGRVKALEVFSNLIVNKDSDFPKNSIPGAVGTGYTMAQLAFINGKAAMMPNGAWLESEMDGLIPEGVEIRMMQTPFIAGAKVDAEGNPIPVNASQAGDFMCVPKDAENKEAALKFVEYVNTREACETFTRITGGLRPFQYLDDLNLDEMNLSGFSKSCIEVYKNSTTVYHYSTNPIGWTGKLGKWPDVSSPYNKLISEYDTASPESICKACCTYAYEEWWNAYNEAVQ